MILNNQFTLGSAIPMEVVSPATMRQVAHLHNQSKSSNNFIFIGNETVSTANGIHLDPAESKIITLEPGDSLWAVSNPNGLSLGVLTVRQAQ
jgi:hypothetical protein